MQQRKTRMRPWSPPRRTLSCVVSTRRAEAQWFVATRYIILTSNAYRVISILFERIRLIFCSQLGPLVIGACVLSPAQEALLTRAGVRDSKELSPSARERLAAVIRGSVANI